MHYSGCGIGQRITLGVLGLVTLPYGVNAQFSSFNQVNFYSDSHCGSFAAALEVPNSGCFNIGNGPHFSMLIANFDTPAIICSAFGQANCGGRILATTALNGPTSDPTNFCTTIPDEALSVNCDLTA